MSIQSTQRKKPIPTSVWRVAALFLAALALAGAGSVPYNLHDKAAYVSQAIIDFLRPGLKIRIESAAVANDGTISVTFNLTDPAGLPLDVPGVFTPGPITLDYVAAWLPPDQDQYVAYTTRLQTDAKGSFTNAGADAGGVLSTLDSGRYKYTFNTKAPLAFDQTATHTVGIYAARTMTEFGIPDNFASATFNFVPAGTKVAKVRDVVKSAGCNACHDQISAHGGRRRGVEMCVLCHTPQSTDPTTGNTVDFNVMIHKLHAGGDLPSVQAGGTYIVNGADYSTVGFPADIRRCESCHSLKSGAAQATSYLTKPTAATCGSCHDNVNFATGENHAGGLQRDNTQCATCHIPQGEIDFDASIRGGHVIPSESSLLAGIQVGIANVANSSAGQKPVVTFSIKDTTGNPLTLKQLAALSFTMAGPTADYGYTGFGSDVTTPGYVTESALTAGACGADGTCTYAFNHAVPAGAKGDVFLRGWFCRCPPSQSGRDGQLQRLPCRPLRARHSAQSDGILRALPQPFPIRFCAPSGGSGGGRQGNPAPGRKLQSAGTPDPHRREPCRVGFQLHRGGLWWNPQRLLRGPLPGNEPNRKHGRHP